MAGPRPAGPPGPGPAGVLAPWLPRLVDVPPPGVVGCSGGPDSLALVALAAAAGWRPVVVHVDHGLRPGTERDWAVVEGAARRFGLVARCVRVEVATRPGGVEAGARAARYGALLAVADEVGAELVAVGHTADDQAETVLLHLLRGAATRGLGAMAPRRGRVVRPLLGLARADTLEICARLGLDPVVDPMNDDHRFRRVWLRREAVPVLEAGAERALRPLLARQAALLRDDDDLLEQLAVREAGALRVVGAGADRPGLDAAGLRALTERAAPLARRVVRSWLAEVGAAPGHPAGLADVDAVTALAASSRRAVVLTGGHRVERRAGVLRLAPAPVAGGRPTVAPVGPVELAWPGGVAAGGWVLDAWVERAPPLAWPDGRALCVVDADRVPERLVVRSARPGERFRPLGAPGAKRVRDALAEAGVAPAARAGHPVVASPAGELVWVLGYRVADGARVGPTTRRFLWLQARPPAERSAR